MRALALALCAQPVFWMGNSALAQSMQGGTESVPSDPIRSAVSAQAPSLPGFPQELDGVRSDRAAPAREPFVLPPVDRPLDPDEYVCGPGDVLEISFWGLQNFKTRVTIDLEGRAFVARIGYLTLQGKSLSEARRLIRESVSRSFPRLTFDVALAEPRTFLVQVVDDVVRPASYPARAVERVATLINRAGGFGPNASKRRVEIRRRDGQVLRVDLLLYALTGDVKHNPHLLDGDVVRVPFEELTATVDGAVNRPGRYELIGTQDLAELVELAGGLAPTATRKLPISVVRRSPDDKQDQMAIPFTGEGQLPAAPLHNEDGVRIPEFNDLQRSVMVIGALAGVAAPEEARATRRFPFVRGDSVRTLLDRVGGVGPLADLTGAYVQRGTDSLPVDLYSLVMLRDLRADRPVELGDTLVVPFKRRSIMVEGSVFKPGPYPYNPNYRIAQYLSLAGGQNRYAQPIDNVRVISPNGETLEYAPDLKIEPGSSLVVPERNYSRTEVVQIVISVASLVLSGLALAYSARKL